MKNEVAIRADIDSNVLSALKNTLYIGADDKSINMVISYCKALGLDPMQKPVHLVPMNSKNERGEWEKRSVVMPGIGLYRIQASRSGLYAGMTEPEFGEDVTETIGKKKITYPKWCKVTIKKKLGKHIVEFSAKEYWKENYAPIGGKEKDSSPNAMWEKRPYGQLAKCAEAQALRKAFPEIVGSQPTAEEMEDKQLEIIKDVSPLKPMTPIMPTIKELNRQLTTYAFEELEGNKTEEMGIEKVIMYLNDKIQNIYDETGLEEYARFKQKNEELLRIFAKENRQDALSLSNSFSAIKAMIKRSEIDDGVIE